MEYTYKKCIDVITGEETACIKRSDGWVIPMHEDNTDYQAYLKWLEAGNKPKPADK